MNVVRNSSADGEAVHADYAQPFDSSTRATMLFDEDIGCEHDPLRELRTLWDGLRTQRA